MAEFFEWLVRYIVLVVLALLLMVVLLWWGLPWLVETVMPAPVSATLRRWPLPTMN